LPESSLAGGACCCFMVILLTEATVSIPQAAR
jgi:hypothetical protein